MPPPVDFPRYGECAAREKLDDLKRLVRSDLFDCLQYIDGRSAAGLIAAGLRAYAKSVDSQSLWMTTPTLARLFTAPERFNLVCAALFDLVCNTEYLHGRVTNEKWIYCNRHRDGSGAPEAYFCFLKQCPRCCLDLGLESRLSGAQHKPSSHHIGELTSTTMAMFLWLLGRTGSSPSRVGLVAKQSHDVDAVAWRSDLLMLFEIKASPLVTFPLRARLERPFSAEGPDGTRVEFPQHKLVDIDFGAYSLDLYLPHLDASIPLGRPSGESWPYPSVQQEVSSPEGFLRYFGAWAEIFSAYRVPKTLRVGRDVSLAYLANGWGDEIDSNKTKPGLGRTDDIKKGTYQLIKYGAYYRAGSPTLPVRAALVANLDPLFMFDEYMAKMLDIRWAPANRFERVSEMPDRLFIRDADLYYLYDSVLAFNAPVVNDPALHGGFDFQRLEAALCAGRLEMELSAWARGDHVVD